MWLNDNRSRIKEEHPGISITELSKLAGKEWNSIGASVKEVSENPFISYFLPPRMDDIVYGDGVEVYHSLYEMKIPEKSLGESVMFALC